MIWVLLTYLVMAQTCDLTSASILAETDWTGVASLQKLRDLMALGLFLAGYVRSDLPASLRWATTAYLGIIALYILVGLGGDMGFGIVAASGAKLALPAILVVAGYGGLRGASDLRLFTIVLTGLGVISTLFGLWEVRHTEFWTDTVEYGEYLISGKDVLTGFRADELLPFNFFGYDSVFSSGDARRAAGIVASPLAQGSFLAFCAILSLGTLRPRHPAAAILLSSLLAYGVYASGTRAALLMLICAIPLYLLLRRSGLKALAPDTTLLAGAVLISSQALATIFDYTIHLEDGSTIGHVWALQDNLRNAGRVWFAGDGLGAAGTLAAMAGFSTTTGLEGAAFSALYQIGGPGAAAFLWLYGAVIVLLYQRRAGPDGDIAAAATAFAIGAASSLVVSDSLMSVSGMACFWLASGGIIAVLPHHTRSDVPQQTPILERRLA